MNITEKIIKKKVIDFLQRYEISEKNKILVAFSGGSDSSALLWILNDIQGSVGYSIHALYVNHGIRSLSEMSDEVERIKDISKKIDVPIDIRSIKQGLIVEESELTDRSIEDVAREYRYSILKDFKDYIGASHIAMGHTMDDQSETLIMRFFQGSGIHGLTGISEKRDDILRPLMIFEKKTLIEYIAKKDIPFVLDKSNLEIVYLRNKIRLNLIPVISDIFPGYQKSLRIFAEKMEMIKPVLSEYAQALDIALTKDGDVWFYSKDFISIPVFRQLETLYKSWDMWENKPFKRLSFRFLRNALGYSSSSSSSNSDILLQGLTCQLIKENDKIFWKRVVVVSVEKSYLRVVTEGNNEIYPGLSIKLEEKTALSKDTTKDTIWISRSSIKKNILARSRIPGDSIRLAEGMKPVKKLFNEWGVIPSDRWEIPILEDGSGIIAVVGRPFGYSNRIALKYKNCSKDTGKLIISAHYMENNT